MSERIRIVMTNLLITQTSVSFEERRGSDTSSLLQYLINQTDWSNIFSHFTEDIKEFVLIMYKYHNQDISDISRYPIADIISLITGIFHRD